VESRLKPVAQHKVRWTETAALYLDAAMDYVAQDSPQAAASLAKKIYMSVQELGTHPQIGRPGRCQGTRELVITGTPYIIPYRIQGSEVQILRVLHGARKWPLKF